ncbi:hypothetical protein ACFE04_008488 [Oxalis oulophora]
MKLIYFLSFVLILVAFPNLCLSDLVSDTCGRTLYKDLCNSILKNQGATDLTSLGAIALKIANSNGQKVQNQISALVKTASPEVKKVLSDCSENLNDAIGQVKDSTTALSKKSYGDVLTWMSAALTDADTCVDGFTQKKITSPVVDTSKTFSQICSIVLTITNILAGKI